MRQNEDTPLDDRGIEITDTIEEARALAMENVDKVESVQVIITQREEGLEDPFLVRDTSVGREDFQLLGLLTALHETISSLDGVESHEVAQATLHLLRAMSNQVESHLLHHHEVRGDDDDQGR